jgi:hypothetical protein
VFVPVYGLVVFVFERWIYIIEDGQNSLGIVGVTKRMGEAVLKRVEGMANVETESGDFNRGHVEFEGGSSESESPKADSTWSMM